jgi:hypothetical protein
MVVSEMFILCDVIDTTARPLSRISSQIVVLTSSSLPGASPKAISSRTGQAIQRSAVTLATAANPIPVVRQTTSKMEATASIWETAEMSAVKAVSSLETAVGGAEDTPATSKTVPSKTSPSLSMLVARLTP